MAMSAATMVQTVQKWSKRWAQGCVSSPRRPQEVGLRILRRCPHLVTSEQAIQFFGPWHLVVRSVSQNLF